MFSDNLKILSTHSPDAHYQKDFVFEFGHLFREILTMHSRFIICAIAFIALIAPSAILGQGNLCTIRRKCGECLQGLGCVWCKDPRFLLEEKAYGRCNTQEGHQLAGGCPQQHLVSLPSASAVEGRSGEGRKGTIHPAGGYTVKLGVGQRINVTLDYTDPGNKPLDLYYLMDLSATMEKHKESVQRLGRELATALRETTSELQIGFGSFIDKPIMPYATLSDITPSSGDGKSVPTYGFQNHLRLTDDVAKFEKVVREARISRNLDAPEGGLDALMQAIECQTEIGWRNDSHHVLVISTDGSFHIAGDGKLAGLVIPNDGRCHLNSDGRYDKSTELDYPSVSQVVAKIRERKTHTIFAVTEDQVALYQELSRLVPDYATTEKFDATSSNAKEIISNQYRLIRATVQLAPEKHPVLQLRYFARCGGRGEPLKADTSSCHGVGPQSALQFVVQLELLRCPESARAWKGVIDISPTSSTSGEKLRVAYELQCGCACEEVDDPPPPAGARARAIEGACTSPAQGTVRCGVCHCREGAYVGERCQCPLAGNETSFQSYLTDEKCRERPDSAEPCSGRGKCECGQCVSCYDGYSSKYCECEAWRCRQGARPPAGGGGGTVGGREPCGGPVHGSCNCDKCECKEGWSGAYCECERGTSACKRAGDGALCGGHGACECNKCVCEGDSPSGALGPWAGRFCDICVAPERSEVCKCGRELQEYISCIVEDKAVQAPMRGQQAVEADPSSPGVQPDGEGGNVTEYKLVLRQGYRDECSAALKALPFEILEPIEFVPNNDFNDPNAGLDEGARFKKCTTPLQSEYRSNCEVRYAYSIVSAPTSGVGASAGVPFKETLKISIRQSPECHLPPPEQDPLVIVLGTSGGVVLIGLLTLILWKVFTYWHDKREYTRFEMERKGAKWDASGNPLYSEPISTFQNPSYRE